MHPKGTSFGAPVGVFFARLDLDQNPSFLERYGLPSTYDFRERVLNENPISL